MPDPIPVVVLARLAVCRSVQGQASLRALLADALSGCCRPAHRYGRARGIVGHAASTKPAASNLHMGFDSLTIDPDTLLIVLSDVAATFAVLI